MNLSLREKLIAGLVGTAIIGGLVFVGGVLVPVVAQATEAAQPAVARVLEPLDPPAGAALEEAHLAKFNGDYFGIETDPGVSLEPQSSVTVRKIAYGQTSFVTVTTTSSGVYSSDGLASAHVRYPGVYVSPVEVHIFPLTGTVLGWSKLTGWTKIPLLAANSFGFLDTDSVPASQDDVCVRDNDTGACR